MFDLGAYLARIGLAGSPSISEVHRAHVTTIPFENLDPYCGIPVSLSIDDVQRKLVTNHRGGYCFEQNLLLKAALEALGAEVEMFLARVRLGAPAGTTRPRTHLVLRVTADGVSRHADVGFGLGSLLEPIPFGPGGEHSQSGWHFRVSEQRSELVLQTIEDDEWVDLYAFDPTPVPFVDVEMSNWFTCTNPRSPFVTGIVVGAHATDGRRTMLRDWDGLALKEQSPLGTTTTPVEYRELPDLLSTRFGLTGYELSQEGNLTPRSRR